MQVDHIDKTATRFAIQKFRPFYDFFPMLTELILLLHNQRVATSAFSAVLLLSIVRSVSTSASSRPSNWAIPM